MTTDVFYATLKLVTGEEILAKVCAFVENDEVMIVLDNPIIVNVLIIPKSKFPLVKINPWNTISPETTHIIRRSHIITMSEVKDKNLVKIHDQYTTDISQSSNSVLSLDPNSSTGFSNVDEARILFERLYNSKESPSNTD